jgi:hypothetical protein
VKIEGAARHINEKKKQNKSQRKEYSDQDTRWYTENPPTQTSKLTKSNQRKQDMDFTL